MFLYTLPHKCNRITFENVNVLLTKRKKTRKLSEFQFLIEIIKDRSNCLDNLWCLGGGKFKMQTGCFISK